MEGNVTVDLVREGVTFTRCINEVKNRDSLTCLDSEHFQLRSSDPIPDNTSATNSKLQEHLVTKECSNFAMNVETFITETDEFNSESEDCQRKVTNNRFKIGPPDFKEIDNVDSCLRVQDAKGNQYISSSTNSATVQCKQPISPNKETICGVSFPPRFQPSGVNQTIETNSERNDSVVQDKNKELKTFTSKDITVPPAKNASRENWIPRVVASHPKGMVPTWNERIVSAPIGNSQMESNESDPTRQESKSLMSISLPTGTSKRATCSSEGERDVSIPGEEFNAEEDAKKHEDLLSLREELEILEEDWNALTTQYLFLAEEAGVLLE